MSEMWFLCLCDGDTKCLLTVFDVPRLPLNQMGFACSDMKYMQLINNTEHVHTHIHTHIRAYTNTHTLSLSLFKTSRTVRHHTSHAGSVTCDLLTEPRLKPAAL